MKDLNNRGTLEKTSMGLRLGGLLEMTTTGGGWLRIKVACSYCGGVFERTICNWMSESQRFSKVKGVVLIKVSNLDEYLEKFEERKNKIYRVVDEVIRGL
jgi:hypothetical protein